MVFRFRPDADLVTDLPATRRIMPFIMPTRNQSLVFFDMEIDAAAIDERIARYRDTGVKATALHVVAVCATRIFAERPRLNRFVAGGRIWQRRGIWLSFSGKKRKDDDAPVVVVKRRVDPALSDEALVLALDGGVKEVRTDKKTRTDQELDIFLALPTFVLGWLVGLVGFLDRVGLLPRFFIDGDPLYASMFIANIGSLGMDAPQHHLYEYGNIPLFCVIGAKRYAFDVDDSGAVVAKQVYPLRFTFDERIEDGLYCLGCLKRLKELLTTTTTPTTPATATTTATTI
jgi:hypothetical protein